MTCPTTKDTHRLQGINIGHSNMLVILMECPAARTARRELALLPREHLQVLDHADRYVAAFVPASFIVLIQWNNSLTRYLRFTPSSRFPVLSNTSVRVVAMKKLSACTSVDGRDARRHMVH